MRWGLRHGFALASVLTACELAVSTSGLDDGKIVNEAGVAVDATPVADGSTSSDVTTADVAVEAGRFCDTVAATFCEDWDEPGRTSPFDNGWALKNPSPLQTVTFAGPGEPVFSVPRALKVFANKDAGSSRISLMHAFAPKTHNEIHFKVYPGAPPDPGLPFLEMNDETGTCSMVIHYNDLTTFCPGYADIVDYPGLPTNTWSELKIVIDNAQSGATVSVTGPFGTLSGTAPAVDFTVLQLGQDEDDYDQTMFFDDVWWTTAASP